jgi:hypothetical protein
MKRPFILLISAMLALSSCYKESTDVIIEDKDMLQLDNITETFRILPVGSRSQHVLTMDAGSYYYEGYTMKFSSQLGLDYEYDEYTDNSYSYDSHFFIIQEIPDNPNLIGLTDTTYIYLQSENIYSDSVFLETYIIEPFNEDFRATFNEFELSLQLQEEISGFTSSFSWKYNDYGDLIYEGNKFFDAWFDDYETGEITAQFNTLFNKVTDFEYFVIEDDVYRKTTLDFTSDNLFLLTMDSSHIEIGFYGPGLFQYNDFEYNEYPPDTLSPSNYYPDVESYFRVTISKD